MRLVALVFTLALFATAAHAQTYTPHVVSFLPSPDHDAVDTNGQPLVSRYDLELTQVGAAQPFAVVSLGKPAPGTDGYITVDFASLIATPPLGVDVQAVVTAVGPSGSADSVPTTAFQFTNGSTCSFTVSPLTVSAAAAAGSSSVTVTAAAGCTWMATSGVTWLTVTAGASGSGNGTVTFAVGANTGGARSGTLTVAGQVVTVNQAAGSVPDTTVPTIAIATPTTATTYSTASTPLAIGGSAADNVGVTQVTWTSDRGVSGTATGTTSWSASVALQSGANVITVTARDAAGNTATDTLTVTYTPADATAPTIAIATPTTATTYSTASTPLAIGGSAADNVGVTQVSWSSDRGGSGTATGTTSWSASVALQSGANVITVTARDAAGNTATDTLTVTYTPADATAPTIAIATPTTATTYSTASTPLAIGGSAADNVGVTQVSWSSDRGGSGTATGTTSWSASVALQSGANVITVTARDAAGNTATDTLTVTYTPADATAPTIAIAVPTSTGTYSTTTTPLTISGSAYDNVGVTQVTWANNRGGSGTASGTTGWSASVALQSGANVVTVTARDAAGNTKTATLTVTYTVPDTTKPTVTITTPTTAGTYTTTRTPLAIAGTASDNVGVAQVTWTNNRGGSGTATGTTAWSASVGLQTGTNIISVTARDAAGNPATATITVTLTTGDATPPSVTITTPTTSAAYTTTSASMTIGGLATDNVGVAKVTWVNDRGGSGTATGTTNWAAIVAFDPGTNVVTVTASDAAGNTATAKVTVTASYTPVPAAITSPAPGSTLSGSSVLVSWNSGTGVDAYWLDVGTSAGGYDLYSGYIGTSRSTTVSGLPRDGSKVWMRLYSSIGGKWVAGKDVSYSTKMPTAARITSPTPGTSLPGVSATFQWDGGAGVDGFWLDVGTAQGAYDISSKSAGTSLSMTINNLPMTGSTIWVRLYSLISGSWRFVDFSYTAATKHASRIVDPAPGSVMPGATATFTWDSGVGVTAHWLDVGTAAGGYDLHSASAGTALSATVTGLPVLGQPLFVRLWSLIDGAWQFVDLGYTEAQPGPAQLVTPVPGSTLGQAATFTWSPGLGVSRYWLDVGTVQGGDDLHSASAGTWTTTTVSNLPTAGQPVWVRLWSWIGNGWQFVDRSFPGGNDAGAAYMLTPSPGATLAPTTTFTWTPAPGAAYYWLDIGTVRGGGDISSRYVSGTTSTVSGLPATGGVIWVRIYSRINGAWQFTDVSFAAPGS